MKSITLAELYGKILHTQALLAGEELNFWKLIKIEPEKWQEPEFGSEEGFWVVAICGKHVIWYNDIEEGFNISKYNVHGHIIGYYCNDDGLNTSVERLFELIKSGGAISGQWGPPISLD